MAILQPSEFNEYYFDGENQQLKHNGGYSDYTKEQPWCEWVANKLVQKFPNLVGKRIVDIGCGYGYTVKRLRDLGVLAFGRDISPFAISQCDPSISSFVEVGDAIDPYPAQVKIAFTSRLLCCFDEAKVLQCVDHFNSNFDYQLHIFDPNINDKYYLSKPWEWWTGLNWNSGTIMLNWYDREMEVIK